MKMSSMHSRIGALARQYGWVLNDQVFVQYYCRNGELASKGEAPALRQFLEIHNEKWAVLLYNDSTAYVSGRFEEEKTW